MLAGIVMLYGSNSNSTHVLCLRVNLNSRACHKGPAVMVNLRLLEEVSNSNLYCMHRAIGLHRRLRFTSIVRRSLSISADVIGPAMQPEEALVQFWGHSSFRSVQKAVINSTIQGHDNLVVMATGAGKSLCFQIPPLVTRRSCIIISPLISLMEDQVNALNARLSGHATACFLGESMQPPHPTHKYCIYAHHMYNIYA